MERESARITSQRRALGERLAAFREAAELTQGELAHRVFRHRTTVVHVEKGRRRADEQFWAMADAAVGADGELLATFHEIEANRQTEEYRLRVTKLADARRRAIVTPMDDPGAGQGLRSLRAQRLRRGWSLEDVAERLVRLGEEAGHPGLGANGTMVGRWERGEREPRPPYPKLLVALYGVDAQELGLMGSADPGRCDWLFPDSLVHTRGEKEDDPTNRRDALKLGLTFAAGALLPETATRLGPGDVDRIQAGIRELYLLDDQQGGGAVYGRAVGQLREVRRLLGTAAYSSTTGRRLQAVAGELTEEVGWLACDAGHQGTARRFFTEALCTAELSGSAQLKAIVFSSMTFQAVEYGDGREGVDLAEAAHGAGRTVGTPKLSSLLAAREALAWARGGDSVRCGSALASAERLLPDEDEGEDPARVAFWGPADFYAVVTRAHLLQGDHEHAVRPARAALSCVDPAYPRNRASYLVHLAQALIGAGEVDEGAAVAADAASCVGAVSSRRVRDRLVALRTPLEVHAAVPGVRECLDQLHDL